MQHISIEDFYNELVENETARWRLNGVLAVKLGDKYILF